MRDIVLAQKTERDELLAGKYVPRDGVEAARKALATKPVKVITGPRRAGKSVFAMQMLKGVDFAYLNFDDERLAGVQDYDELLKSIRQVYGTAECLFFDEIQNLPKWELFVNRLHRKGHNVIATGSNAHLLSAELATHLTGRHLQFKILPFSFTEFLRARGFSVDESIRLKENQGLTLKHLHDYVVGGGYPEVVVSGLDAKSYMVTLFESILFKDVTKRYGIRYAKQLHDLGRYLITNHSNEFSYSRLKKALGFRSVHTVEKYVGYLAEAFLLFTLDRFSFKLKEQMKAPRKAYAYDMGMANAVKLMITPDAGKVMENVVAVELLRRGAEFYYYKTSTGREVDFVVKEGLGVKQLIQACYSLDDHQTKKREITALDKAAHELRCDSLLLLTWDQESEERAGDKRIAVRPLWKWLLNLA
jgi:predicted AAA+ superfamily ATPase